MTIPSVVQGLIEAEDGKVFELDSPKGKVWLESVASFRFESVGANKPYTVRKESGKGGDYWYGYRKQNGKLHKKYIGKSSELSTAKLEEIAEALNTPPQPRVTDSELQIELGNLRDENEALKAELAEVRSQTETAQAIPSVTASPKFELPEPAEVLNRLKAKRKKSKIDLGDVITLWEILEKS